MAKNKPVLAQEQAMPSPVLEKPENLAAGTCSPDIAGHHALFGKLEPLPTWRRVLIFFGLCSGLFLSLMDTSIISTSIYTIAIEFNSLAKTVWVVLAYTLTYLGQ